MVSLSAFSMIRIHPVRSNRERESTTFRVSGALSLHSDVPSWPFIIYKFSWCPCAATRENDRERDLIDQVMKASVG